MVANGNVTTVARTRAEKSRVSCPSPPILHDPFGWTKSQEGRLDGCIRGDVGSQFLSVIYTETLPLEEKDRVDGEGNGAPGCLDGDGLLRTELSLFDYGFLDGAILARQVRTGSRTG